MKLYKMKKEIWKGIPGWIGYYQASTFGRIKSLSRKYSPKEKILRQTFSKSIGYLQVQLYKDNKIKNYEIHKLILLTFEGTYPKGMECCHNDDIKINNYYNNLRYDTRKGNIADRKKYGTLLIGEKCNWAKLTEKQVWKIRKLLKFKKYYQREIAKMFNVHLATISDIKRSITWSWLK